MNGTTKLMKIVNEKPLESGVKGFIYIQTESRVYSRFSLDINEKAQSVSRLVSISFYFCKEAFTHTFCIW